MPEVSIIVLNYRSYPECRRCIHSILSETSKSLDYEVILTDNASPDNSFTKLREEFSSYDNIKFLRLSKNYGYAGGNNVAARIASGKYLVILNPDIVVTRNWLKPLIQVLEHNSNIAAAQGKILMSKNIIDSTGIFIDIYGNIIRRGYGEEDRGQYDYNTPDEIFSITGSAFIVRRDLFLRVSGFDPDYFMYCEEIDLSWRLRLLGYKIVYISKSVVYHKHRPKQGGFRKTLFRYYDMRNKILTYMKNYGTLPHLSLFFIGLASGMFLDIIRFEKIKENSLGPKLLAMINIMKNLSKIIRRRKTTKKNINVDNYVLKPPISTMFILLKIKKKYSYLGFQRVYEKYVLAHW